MRRFVAPSAARQSVEICFIALMLRAGSVHRVGSSSDNPSSAEFRLSAFSSICQYMVLRRCRWLRNRPAGLSSASSSNSASFSICVPCPGYSPAISAEDQIISHSMSLGRWNLTFSSDPLTRMSRLGSSGESSCMANDRTEGFVQSASCGVFPFGRNQCTRSDFFNSPILLSRVKKSSWL